MNVTDQNTVEERVHEAADFEAGRRRQDGRPVSWCQSVAGVCLR